MLRRAVELGLRASGRERAALYTVPAALWDALFGNAPGATQTAMEAANTSRERYVEYGAAFALARQAMLRDRKHYPKIWKNDLVRILRSG